MDRARELAEAYARADAKVYGASAKSWAPFTYTAMVWTRLDCLLTERKPKLAGQLISLDQKDHYHTNENQTFLYPRPAPKSSVADDQVSAEDPRRGRGVAAIRLYGMSTS